MTQAGTYSLQRHTLKDPGSCLQLSPVPGITSVSHGVVPGGDPGAGIVLYFLLEIAPGRMVITHCSVDFPEILRLISFNKVLILL